MDSLGDSGQTGNAMLTPRIFIALEVLAVGWLGVTGGGCTADLGGDEPNDRVIGSTAGDQTHIISDDWEKAPVRLGNNLKMLNFAQMQSEVLRATSIAYDGWAENRAVFGGPDFKTTFQDDRTPTATKILTWRKIAFSVCASMITKETTTPALFASIAPTAAISAADPKVGDQVTAMFTKFFLEAPSSVEVEASTKALTDTVAAGGSPVEAWGTLCVAYLSSMRFLTY